MNARHFLCTLLASLLVIASARAQSEPIGLGRPVVEPALAVVPPQPFTPPPPAVVVPEPMRVDPPWLRTEFAVRSWFSTGQSTLSTAGAGGAPPVLSHLTWSRLDNTIVEFSGNAILRDRWIVDLAFGVGTNGPGRMRDFDFNDDQSLASDTVHPVRNDNLFYFNIDLGHRFFIVDLGRDGRGRFTIDGLIGYQHWQERYLANDGYDLFPGTRVFPQGRTSENRFSWDSLRIGARARIEYPVWSLEARLYGIPVTSFQDYDIHYRRTDVLQDPSFLDRATGGGGVNADLTFRYRVWRGLNIELGYRWWSIYSGNGTSTARTPTGDLVGPLNDARTYRQGLTFGLLYQF